MDQYNENHTSLKEIEHVLFHALQQTFHRILLQLLTNLDQRLADNRDKKRFVLHDKRATSLETTLGAVTLRRNYYRDRQSGQYVYLLDRFLSFAGPKHFSPAFEQWALEEAVDSSSYRKAAAQIERFLGYRAISHETIRQQVLETEILPPQKQLPAPKVLFLETDGLFSSRQKAKGAVQPRPGKEAKMVCVHSGWKKAPHSGESRLVTPCIYYHNGKEPFWEGVQHFLEETYDLDYTQTDFVISGDGASWIAAGEEVLGPKHTLYHHDTFHITRDLRQLMKHHPRYPKMVQALKQGQPDQLLLELNSAAGTMETEEQEARLGELSQRIDEKKTAFSNFKSWLEAHGHDTKDMATLGASESVMSLMARRMKYHRSWSDAGYDHLQELVIAKVNGLKVVLPGEQRVFRLDQDEVQSPLSAAQVLPKKSCEKAAVDTLHENLPYLKQSAAAPICSALKGLAGY
ncbi:ISLre2 family transposase [Sporolactobacillus sp. CPB3-1]|uniref:ISLre2 family transposase n=1 Tax=Sporolactobacillus mangiferae TaxID=2940498 RepID=A0ABT0M7W2_9BACL|nr:ISLre2 family transposase [Sporolactobacillus mangiferae]MCL1630956.1 ISLre2 family transposase [Sporolactobacillus mangiferae]